jgi:hypothetical protein
MASGDAESTPQYLHLNTLGPGSDSTNSSPISPPSQTPPGELNPPPAAPGTGFPGSTRQSKNRRLKSNLDVPSTNPELSEREREAAVGTDRHRPWRRGSGGESAETATGFGRRSRRAGEKWGRESGGDEEIGGEMELLADAWSFSVRTRPFSTPGDYYDGDDGSCPFLTRVPTANGRFPRCRLVRRGRQGGDGMGACCVCRCRCCAWREHPGGAEGKAPAVPTGRGPRTTRADAREWRPRRTSIGTSRPRDAPLNTPP